MVKVALSYSPEVGGASVEAVRDVFTDLGAKVENADFRQALSAHEIPADIKGSAREEHRQKLDDEIMQDEERFLELFQQAKEHAVKTLADMDYLVVPGNVKMIHPGLFGVDREDHQSSDVMRTIAELALIDVAVNRGMPIMGICGGHQLINVYFGGTLKPLSEEQLREQNVMEFSPVRIDPNSSVGQAFYRKEVSPKGIFRNLEMFGAHFEVVDEIGGKGILTGGEDLLKPVGHSVGKTKKEVEAIESVTGAPIKTTQFHPEVNLHGLPRAKGGDIYAASMKEDKEPALEYFKVAMQEAETFHRKKEMHKELKRKVHKDDSLEVKMKVVARSRKSVDVEVLKKRYRDPNKGVVIRAFDEVSFLFKKGLSYISGAFKYLFRRPVSKYLVSGAVKKLKKEPKKTHKRVRKSLIGALRGSRRKSHVAKLEKKRKAEKHISRPRSETR